MRADGSISSRFRCPSRHVALPQRVHGEVLRVSTGNNTETATMTAVQTVEQQLAAGGHCLTIRRTVQALTPRPWPSVVLQPHAQTGEWEVCVAVHFQETVAFQWDRITQDVICEIDNALTPPSTPSTATHVLRIKATWRCHKLSFSGAVVVEAPTPSVFVPRVVLVASGVAHGTLHLPHTLRYLAATASSHASLQLHTATPIATRRSVRAQMERAFLCASGSACATWRIGAGVAATVSQGLRVCCDLHGVATIRVCEGATLHTQELAVSVYAHGCVVVGDTSPTARTRTSVTHMELCAHHAAYIKVGAVCRKQSSPSRHRDMHSPTLAGCCAERASIELARPMARTMLHHKLVTGPRATLRWV